MNLRDYLFYEEPGVTLYCGDALTVLRNLPDESVQCCITSPPYWGLRDYGTATWEGGHEGCDHLMASPGGTRNKGRDRAASNGAFHDSPRVEPGLAMPHRDLCGNCGARRIDAQLGLEPTPEAYVAALVEVFREVRRVLRDDGTLWLNLGDSYAAGAGKVGESPGGGEQGERWKAGATNTVDPKGRHGLGPMTQPNRMPIAGLKPKDLVGIPWRVAFALQADGWYLRSDIIWAKPNPMPESVTDRPTKAHEYLFLLSKSERYYYDSEAIKERAEWPDGPNSPQSIASPYGQGFTRRASLHMKETQRNDGDRWRVCDGGVAARGSRNRRTIWTIATQPYPEAHFATFPPDLVKPCVLAGAPVAGVALDPFAGAGTTLYVAKELSRKTVGIELNPDYCALAVNRLRQGVLL